MRSISHKMHLSLTQVATVGRGKGIQLLTRLTSNQVSHLLSTWSLLTTNSKCTDSSQLRPSDRKQRSSSHSIGTAVLLKSVRSLMMQNTATSVKWQPLWIKSNLPQKSLWSIDKAWWCYRHLLASLQSTTATCPRLKKVKRVLIKMTNRSSLQPHLVVTTKS